MTNRELENESKRRIETEMRQRGVETQLGERLRQRGQSRDRTRIETENRKEKKERQTDITHIKERA